MRFIKHNNNKNTLTYAPDPRCSFREKNQENDRIDYLYFQLLVLSTLSQLGEPSQILPCNLYPDRFKFSKDVSCSLEENTAYFCYLGTTVAIHQDQIEISSNNKQQFTKMTAALDTNLTPYKCQAGIQNHRDVRPDINKCYDINLKKTNNPVIERLRTADRAHGAAELFCSSLIGNPIRDAVPQLVTKTELEEEEDQKIVDQCMEQFKQPGYQTITGAISAHIETLINELKTMNPKLGETIENNPHADFNPETHIRYSWQTASEGQFTIDALFGTSSARIKAHKINTLRTLLGELSDSNEDTANDAIQSAKKTINQQESFLSKYFGSRTQQLLKNVGDSTALFSQRHTLFSIARSNCGKATHVPTRH